MLLGALGTPVVPRHARPRHGPSELVGGVGSKQVAWPQRITLALPPPPALLSGME